MSQTSGLNSSTTVSQASQSIRLCRTSEVSPGTRLCHRAPDCVTDIRCSRHSTMPQASDCVTRFRLCRWHPTPSPGSRCQPRHPTSSPDTRCQSSIRPPVQTPVMSDQASDLQSRHLRCESRHPIPNAHPTHSPDTPRPIVQASDVDQGPEGPCMVGGFAPRGAHGAPWALCGSSHGPPSWAFGCLDPHRMPRLWVGCLD